MTIKVVSHDDSPAPDLEKLKAAREYCAEAAYSQGAGNHDAAMVHLICAVDHMIAAWQQ